MNVIVIRHVLNQLHVCRGLYWGKPSPHQLISPSDSECRAEEMVETHVIIKFAALYGQGSVSDRRKGLHWPATLLMRQPMLVDRWTSLPFPSCMPKPASDRAQVSTAPGVIRGPSPASRRRIYHQQTLSGTSPLSRGCEELRVMRAQVWGWEAKLGPRCNFACHGKWQIGVRAFNTAFERLGYPQQNSIAVSR